KPGRDDIGIGAGSEHRVCTKAFSVEVVTDDLEQIVRPLAVAARRAQRELVGNAEPGRVEVDKRAVLVEQDPLDAEQSGYSAFASACRCRTSPAVDASRPAALSLPSTTGSSPVASSLPSSTPHWSKALMPNSCASTKTRCS